MRDLLRLKQIQTCTGLHQSSSLLRTYAARANVRRWLCDRARMSAITAEQSEVMRNDVSQLRLLLESGQGGEGAHASSESLRCAPCSLY